jgi:hypothetical protein
MSDLCELRLTKNAEKDLTKLQELAEEATRGDFSA